MEKKEEFPKTAKEFYDNLVKLNTLGAMNITIEAVEKLYSFQLNPKKNNYLAIYISIKECNEEDTNERKGAHQIYGICPKCGNVLSGTGGTHNIGPNSKKPPGIQYGRYCLKCGKIYLKENWRKNIFTEVDTPLFGRSLLSY